MIYPLLLKRALWRKDKQRIQEWESTLDLTKCCKNSQHQQKHLPINMRNRLTILSTCFIMKLSKRHLLINAKYNKRLLLQAVYGHDMKKKWYYKKWFYIIVCSVPWLKCKQWYLYIWQITFSSPDDHIAVATHGRTSPCRNVLCHLDQGVLIFRMGLRYRSDRDGNPWDTGTAVTLHTERRKDETGLWTVTCIYYETNKSLYK